MKIARYLYIKKLIERQSNEIHFLQNEMTHLMENVVFSELQVWGFNVEVGVVPAVKTNEEGPQCRSQSEMDFVCYQGCYRHFGCKAKKHNNKSWFHCWVSATRSR